MRQLSTYLLIACLLCSCHEDVDNTVFTEDKPLPDTTIEGELTGRAYNNDGEALSDYSLRINGLSYEYNAGYHFQHIESLKKFGQIIFLEQDQVTIGFSNNLLIENDINAVDIIALPQREMTRISTTSHEIDINQDITININRTQLLDNQGAIPASDILVNHLVTSTPELLSQCGTFAYSQDRKLLVVEPIHVFLLDLYSDNRQLTVDSNNPLQLQSSISDATLFFLDEERGTWMEIESINDAGISETGFYMIGYAADGVYNEGIVRKDAVPVSYVDLMTAHELDDTERYTQTTAQGKWAMVSYENENVRLNFTTPCGELLAEQNIEISNTNNLDIVNELDAVTELLPLEFELFNCGGDISEVPAIRIESASEIRILPYIGSDVHTWVTVCDEKFSISGFDVVDKIDGPQIAWGIDIPDAISYLSSCDQSEDGFSLLRVREDLRMYNSANFEVEGLRTKISGNDDRLRINFDGFGIGTYDGTQVRMFLEDFDFGPFGYRVTCENAINGCGFAEFNVTHFDIQEGEWTRVSFSGNLWMQTINPPQAGFFDVEGVLMHK